MRRSKIALAVAVGILAAAMPGHALAGGAAQYLVSGRPYSLAPLCRSHGVDGEVSLAIDHHTGRMVAAWMQDIGPTASLTSSIVLTAASTDGGRTWTRTVPSGVMLCERPPGPDDGVFDPSVSVGPDGRWYLARGGAEATPGAGPRGSHHRLRHAGRGPEDGWASLRHVEQLHDRPSRSGQPGHDVRDLERRSDLLAPEDRARRAARPRGRHRPPRRALRRLAPDGVRRDPAHRVPDRLRRPHHVRHPVHRRRADLVPDGEGGPRPALGHRRSGPPEHGVRGALLRVLPGRRAEPFGPPVLEHHARRRRRRRVGDLVLQRRPDLVRAERHPPVRPGVPAHAGRLAEGRTGADLVRLHRTHAGGEPAPDPVVGGLAGPFDMRTAAPVGAGYLGDFQSLVPAGNGFEAAFTLAEPQAKHGPTDIFAKAVP